MSETFYSSIHRVDRAGTACEYPLLTEGDDCGLVGNRFLGRREYDAAQEMTGGLGCTSFILSEDLNSARISIAPPSPPPAGEPPACGSVPACTSARSMVYRIRHAFR